MVESLTTGGGINVDVPLRVVPADDYDQVVRLAAFRRAHPDVLVRDLGRGGIWQGTIPRADGEDTYTRVDLKDLLDKLSEVLASGR
jgi:hypothetical protein